MMVTAACAASSRAPREAMSTLDANVQLVARTEIERAVAEWQPIVAVVVILDARNGAILAMEGRDRGHDDPALASTRTYVTGSTLKTFTIAAALDPHTINLDAHAVCA